MEINDDRIKAERICLALHHGGRRKAAYIFDTAFILLTVFAALYLAARAKHMSRASSMLTSAAASLTVFAVYRVIDGELLARRTKKLRARAKTEAAELKLTLNPEPVFALIEAGPGKKVFRRTDILTADDLRELLDPGGEETTIVTLAEPTEKARKLLSVIEGVKLISPLEALSKSADELFPVTENEIDRALIARYGRLISKPSLPKGVFRITRERAGKYLAVGAGLFLLSLFMRYSLYFRLMGSLNLSLGAAFFAFDTIKKAGAGSSPSGI